MKTGKLPLIKRIRYTLKGARGVPILFDLTRFKRLVQEVRKFGFYAFSDMEILEEALCIHSRIHDSGNVGGEIARCFAIVAQAFKRHLGIDVFDEQLLAAIAMAHEGLAEMATGEGKAFAAAFTATLWAMEGRGVHVLTANDYLADRDEAWLGPVYSSLGFRVASVREGMLEDEWP